MEILCFYLFAVDVNCLIFGIFGRVMCCDWASVNTTACTHDIHVILINPTLDPFLPFLEINVLDSLHFNRE